MSERRGAASPAARGTFRPGAAWRASALCLFLAASPPAAAQAGKRFVLERQNLGSGRIQAAIRDRRSGEILWRRTLAGIAQTAWSPDGRCVAVAEDLGTSSPDGSYIHLVVWRAGRGSQVYRDFRRFETLRSLVWSPDTRKLLVLGPYSQGEAGQGFGRLWCLHLGPGKMHLLANGAVTRTRWIDNHRVRYWVGSYVSDPNVPKAAKLRETAHTARCAQ